MIAESDRVGILARFEKYVSRGYGGTSGPDGSECWEWLANRNWRGYGMFHVVAGKRGAHRVAYELWVNEIPAGLTIDHLCRNRGCVNPAHLEAVTMRVNVLRGESPHARNARKTHCKRGHEFTPENTHRRVTKFGPGRECRICRADIARAWADRRRSGPRESVTPETLEAVRTLGDARPRDVARVLGIQYNAACGRLKRAVDSGVVVKTAPGRYAASPDLS